MWGAQHKVTEGRVAVEHCERAVRRHELVDPHLQREQENLGRQSKSAAGGIDPADACNQYVRDSSVGARLGSDAITGAMQTVYHGRSAREGIFHVHMH